MRSVIITGVSRGLGAALFDEFHAAGDSVFAVGRQFSPAQHAAELAEPSRIRLRHADLSRPADLPDSTELSTFARASTVHEGPTDIAGSIGAARPDAAHPDAATDIVLIHNAAVLGPVGAIGALDADEISQAMAVNVTAPMLLTNALLATEVRPVTILFISSGVAQRPVEGLSVYSVTKLAAEAFFDAVAVQCATDAWVRVATVQPGMIDTDMQGLVRSYATADGYFPGRDLFLDRYLQGDLPTAKTVAQKIIVEHLGVTTT